MKIEDYNKYYIQNSNHYLIPKDVFIELFEELENWKEENKILRKNAENNDKVVDNVNWENMLLKKENQELKSQLKGTTHCFDEEEHEKLKKQVENYKKLGFKYLQDKNNNLEKQQKEFIEYLESEIDRLEKTEFYIDSIQKAAIETHKHNLSKYKEIIGVSDDKTN